MFLQLLYSLTLFYDLFSFLSPSCLLPLSRHAARSRGWGWGRYARRNASRPGGRQGPEWHPEGHPHCDARHAAAALFWAAPGVSGYAAAAAAINRRKGCVRCGRCLFVEARYPSVDVRRRGIGGEGRAGKCGARERRTRGAGSKEGVRERWGDGERDEGLGAMSLLSLSESVGGGER